MRRRFRFVLSAFVFTVAAHSPTSANGDFNGDAVVNHNDLNILAHYYLNDPGSLFGDLNADGRVDSIDVLLFSNWWFDLVIKRREADLPE